MTQDEIIKLAKAYGFTGGFDADGKLLHDEAFVVAVTEAVDREREACADMVFRYIAQTTDMEARGCLASVTHDIRARGETTLRGTEA